MVEPSAEQFSSDAGLLPLRQLDEQLGLTRQIAEALTDLRHQEYVDHSFLDMTRMRIYGIVADYPDQNDHDVLRSDPIFKLICDRSIADSDLASQPTLSRFENAIDVGSFFRLRDVLIDQFIASFDKPPTRLTLDMDPFDDPTHGQQQLTFFHGYYDQYQYPNTYRVRLPAQKTTWYWICACSMGVPTPRWQPIPTSRMWWGVCDGHGPAYVSTFVATVGSGYPKSTARVSSWISSIRSALA